MSIEVSSFDGIGGRIKLERSRLGMSQDDLGSIAGVGYKTVGLYEAGKRSPDAEFLARIGAHGIDVLYVITGRREAQPTATAGGGLPAVVNGDPVRPDTTEPGAVAVPRDGGLLAPEGVSVARPLMLPVTFAGGEKREYQVVPNLKAAAQAGEPGSNPVDERDVVAEVVGLIALERQYMRRALGRDGGGFITVQVRGDSMEPALHDGDVIVVDTNRSRVDVDGIYVLHNEGDLLVKRIQRMLDNSLVLRSDNPAYPPQTVQAGAVHTLRIIGRMVRLRIG